MKKALLLLSTTVSILLLAVILVVGLPLKKSLATYQNKLQQVQKQFDCQLEQSYQVAVQDAANARKDKVYNRLLSITPDNPDLKWREVGGEPQVLMVTWTSGNRYDEEVGQKMKLTRDVWATAVPELKNFASKLKLNENNLNIRLKQYLGLPPCNSKTKFVQMWVKPEDLFRPCPDPEIDDTKCDLDFPKSEEEEHKKRIEEHKKWINKQIINSYAGTGYPWTRLGYTYDRGSTDSKKIGASEFVVHENAEVDIDSIMNTVDYVRG